MLVFKSVSDWNRYEMSGRKEFNDTTQTALGQMEPDTFSGTRHVGCGAPLRTVGWPGWPSRRAGWPGWPWSWARRRRRRGRRRPLRLATERSLSSPQTVYLCENYLWPSTWGISPNFPLLNTSSQLRGPIQYLRKREMSSMLWSYRKQSDYSHAAPSEKCSSHLPFKMHYVGFLGFKSPLH